MLAVDVAAAYCWLLDVCLVEIVTSWRCFSYGCWFVVRVRFHQQQQTTTISAALQIHFNI